MNLIISAVVGGIIAVAGVFGGVQALSSTSDGVSKANLYNYADN